MAATAVQGSHAGSIVSVRMQWKIWSLPKTPLELARVILKVLREIKNDGEYNPDEDESFIVGAQYFFNAFNSAVAVTEKRDANFILSLAARVPDI